MKHKRKLVLDTSIFVNPDSRVLFGANPGEALVNFLEIAQKNKDLACYMPPSVYEELMKFVETGIPPKKTVTLHRKPPASYHSLIPALLLYEFIEEMRNRINKGLRIAEKHARRGLKTDPAQIADPEKEQEFIQTLRHEYRIALREGVLDSKEDFDLILLAKEMKAVLATSDQGLVTWAQKLGIHCVSALELKELILHE